MENASKAIIMAGGILIGVIILSLLVLVFRPMGDIYEQEGASLSVEQLEKYNRQFNTYDKSLYGSELVSLANLVADYNNRVLQGADQKYIRENRIDVTVTMATYEIGTLIDDDGKVIKRFAKNIKFNQPVGLTERKRQHKRN